MAADCIGWWWQHLLGGIDGTAAEQQARAVAAAEVVVGCTAGRAAEPPVEAVDGIYAPYCPDKCLGQMSYSTFRMCPAVVGYDNDAYAAAMS